MGFNRQKEKGMRPDYKGKEPYYTSGKMSNPHLKGKKISNAAYRDHGYGCCDEDYDKPKTSERKIW